MTEKQTNTYLLKIEVDEQELDDIFKELESAKRAIYECYGKLELLGVAKLKRAFPQESPDDNQ